MFIKIGRVYLVVVGEDGAVPLLAYRLSQFARLALRIYGTIVDAVGSVGLTRHQVQKQKKKLDAMDKATRTQENAQ